MLQPGTIARLAVCGPGPDISESNVFYYLQIIFQALFLPRFLSAALKSTIERSCPFPVLLLCFAQTRDQTDRSDSCDKVASFD